jgi:beta-galactosidase
MPDRTTLSADGQDLSYVTVELVDANGVRNPNAQNLVKFAVTGPGDIIAVANANPMSTESYQQPQRKAWQGRCLVIIKAGKEPGQISLTVSSEGLSPAKVVITASTSGSLNP